MTPENPQLPTPSAAPSRMTQIALLVSLLMLGAGTGLYLWNDIRQKNTDVTLAQRLVTEYQTNSEPRIREFVTGLQTFAKSNPDFTPILAKYNLAGGAGNSAPSATAPAKK